MHFSRTYTSLLLVCLLLSAGCDSSSESIGDSRNNETKESSVSKAVEGNAPSEPDKRRDMATVENETTRYKTEKATTVMEMHKDRKSIEEDKISLKSPVETSTQ